ncbi:MAG: hypothetical protein JNM69_40660 [Archangium sp.]|nr:hypothetical protein [Archangium sp.]
MNALLLMAVLAQAPVNPPADQPSFRLHVGGQLGLPILLGLGTTGTFHVAGKPRFDVDLWWEPSGFLQSYSLGGAWRPADRFFFVGARLRLLQFQPPWTKGFNGANDNHFGASLETGVRLRVGPADKGVIHVALSGTYVPTQSINLRWLIGLTAGFSWAVWER